MSISSAGDILETDAIQRFIDFHGWIHINVVLP